MTVRCSGCGASVDEPDRIEDRASCPACGSLARTMNVTLNDSIQVHESLAIKMRHGEVGKVKPFREQTSGEDYHQDTGEWRQVSRLVDRENDRYAERIIDVAGNVVREVDEPLSQHRGRGAAKRRLEEPPRS
jgi:NAD-dependent SIR2 family protein deacetylase